MAVAPEEAERRVDSLSRALREAGLRLTHQRSSRAWVASIAQVRIGDAGPIVGIDRHAHRSPRQAGTVTPGDARRRLVIRVTAPGADALDAGNASSPP